MGYRYTSIALLQYYNPNHNMGYLGFEPRTYRLKADYSTIELVTHTILLSDTHKIISE